MVTTVPLRVSEFFSLYPKTNSYPWRAGSSEGLVTQVFLCSDPMDAVAYLALNHAKYPDLGTLFFYGLGSSFPARVNLPKAKITLLFENTPLGKLWDIKTACLIRNRPIKIRYRQQYFEFQCNGKLFSLPAGQTSLHAFEQAADIRTYIRTAKAKGYTTYYEQLLNTAP